MRDCVFVIVDIVCSCVSAPGTLTSLSSPLSAAVVTAISLYMRHLGVRTKSGDKKSGRNFFRKKVLRSSLALSSLRISLGASSHFLLYVILETIVFLFIIFPQVMGNRRSDEPPKTKKGLSSILDPARWNRGEPSGKRASPTLTHPTRPRSSSLSHFCFSSRLSTSKGRG